MVCKITSGDLIQKPGWIRMSIHPTTTTEEIAFVCENIKALAAHHKEWSVDYEYNPRTNEFIHKKAKNEIKEMAHNWFQL